MPAFLENYERFRGKNIKNEKGQDLDAFLEAYHPGDWETPAVTADVIVVRLPAFAPSLEQASVLLVKRRNHPCIGEWALPGGFVNIREDVLTAAKRELEEETGIMDLPLVQMHTWGEYDRDPRSRIVTVSHLAVIQQDISFQAGDDAADAAFFHVDLTLLGREQEDFYSNRIYQLTLTHEEETVSAEVLVKERTDGLLHPVSYHMQKTSGLAFDHGRILVQGLLYLQNNLEK